ncbi:oligopeptidase B [Olivibacter ginsenosidimutans]|uniref:Oligopeptidase B n=1 Tax=Olivibacter ginsenosidimutans TaxID=1176537 RepID=A0ABP9C116_9SPHI
MKQKQSQLPYQWPAIEAPLAIRRPRERVLHEDRVVDDYYWLNDYFKNGPNRDEVIEYLKAENAYVDGMMAGTKDFQDQLFHELKARIKEQDESVPYLKNGYYYYIKTEEGKQYFKYCRKKGTLEAPEEVLLDVDQMAEGHPYFSVVGFDVSPDTHLMVFGVDTLSRREYTLYIKNIRTGEFYPESISGTTGDVAWANDNETFFYTAKNPETLLTEKILKHRLGKDSKTDEVVYEEQDKSNYIGVERAKSGRFIYINSSATTSSETYFILADQPESAFKCFQKRMKDVLYEVTALEDRFLILTNKDALNFKLMECPLDRTNIAHWKEVIGHREDVLLEGVDEFKDFLVVTERRNGLAQFQIRHLGSGENYYLDFGEAAYTATTGANMEYHTDVLRYNYTSLTTPSSVYDYRMSTREKVLKKQQEVLGGYDPTAYISERIYATADDGVKIPISLVYQKAVPRDSNAPLLLYGYGSYGASMDPSFSSTRLSLLERGFIFAIAHIRGGQEMGRQWYEDGKLMKKKNTFLDFIACARHLIAQGYTSREHLYAQGGSAGGLLIGVVMNEAPELWNGLIAQVPFVDVVNTMLDENIPLTTNEYDEWGNPNEPEAYWYMKSYAPYENIEAKDYPHLLVTTGLHDSQVQYFEPAKWVAKLRAIKTGPQVLLLKTEMDYGHGGASGRFDYLKDVALNYAFLLTLEGIFN